MSGLLPHGSIELILWIVLSISAGICEEVVFRGYLQRQFAAFTQKPWIGWLLQAVLFGVAHGYQGINACVNITVIGALLGLLAMWRRSVRPGMICHASMDILAVAFVR
jgi:membrane protease YdiL (CAAX protease family)